MSRGFFRLLGIDELRNADAMESRRTKWIRHLSKQSKPQSSNWERTGDYEEA